MSILMTATAPVTLSPMRRAGRALLAGGLACVAALASLLPAGSLPSLTCAFHELTGHSCFTCGLTRSFSAIAHGNFSASLGYHLMGPPLFLGLLATIFCLGGEALTGREWYPRREGGYLRIALVLFVLVWVTYGGVRLALEFVG